MPVVPVIRQPVAYSTANYVCIGCTVANLASENRRLLFRSQAGARGATATFQPSALSIGLTDQYLYPSI